VNPLSQWLPERKKGLLIFRPTLTQSQFSSYLPVGRARECGGRSNRERVRAGSRRSLPCVPAIFPASETLVEKHEIEKKQGAGLHGSIRGRSAAAVDAAGAATGSIGLFGFALLVEHLAGCYRPSIVLLSATILWFAIAGLLWRLRKSGMLKRHRAGLHAQRPRP
jgi:hypothetical protein